MIFHRNYQSKIIIILGSSFHYLRRSVFISLAELLFVWWMRNENKRVRIFFTDSFFSLKPKIVRNEENERLVMQSTLVKNCVWPIEEIYRTLLPHQWTRILKFNFLKKLFCDISSFPLFNYTYVIHLTPSYLLISYYLRFKIKIYIYIYIIIRKLIEIPSTIKILEALFNARRERNVSPIQRFVPFNQPDETWLSSATIWKINDCE